MKQNKTKNAAEEQLLAQTVSQETAFRGLGVEFEALVEKEQRRYDLLMSMKRERQEAHLTQDTLAQAANLPRTTITKIESGTYNPTIATLTKIAAALGKKLEIRFV